MWYTVQVPRSDARDTFTWRRGGGERSRASVIADDDPEPQAEPADRAPQPPAQTRAPGDLNGQTNGQASGKATGETGGVSDRVRAARRVRARRRTRLRQAISARKRAASTWVETLGRVWIAVALLALVAGIASLEVGVARRSASPPAPPIPEEPPSLMVVYAPEIEPEPLTGPEINQNMVEANGPIAGCTFQPRLGELRAKIGAEQVGDCVDGPILGENGATRQRTTRGTLALAQDGQASFADGEHTWIAGPNGLVRRRAEERFAWEPDADAGPRPEKNTHVLPPAQPGSVLPARRIVSYYGNPLASGMGVLGELPPEQLFPRLKAQAAAYKAADAGRAVQPALELVAVVAQAQPGADGLYRLRMDTELIERVASWAEEHDFLLILDVQIGRGRVDDEVQWLLPFLKRPNIHLALDPEFAMPANHVPGQRIGTMDASAINGALKVLADLVESEKLPPKMLVVHRFTEEMVTGASQIATDPRVQVVMVMDGFGSPSAKTKQYDELIAEPRVQYTGFKLFYRHDEPLMTPEQVLLLDPAPDLIIYQ